MRPGRFVGIGDRREHAHAFDPADGDVDTVDELFDESSLGIPKEDRFDHASQRAY